MSSQRTIVEDPRQPEMKKGETVPPSSASVAETGETPQNPARRIVRVLLPLLVLLLAWYVLTDRMAPSSSIGFVSAYTAQITPRVSGEVVDVLVTDNQKVAKGQVLMRLDPRPFELAVRQAEANLDQALQSGDISRASLNSAQAQMEQAEAQLTAATAQFERTQSLFESGVVPPARMTGAEVELAGARTALRAAEAGLETARILAGAEDNALPMVEVARTQLAQAKLNLSFATVRAPEAGVITNLNLAVGRFIGAGSPAMTFIASEEPWVMVDLRENQLGHVDAGDAVGILFDGQPGRIYPGVVHSIAWGIDPGRIAPNGLMQNQASTRWFEPARTIPVHIKLDHAAGTWPENVRVGSKVNVVVYATGRDNPVSWLAGALHQFAAYVSYLY